MAPIYHLSDQFGDDQWVFGLLIFALTLLCFVAYTYLLKRLTEGSCCCRPLLCWLNFHDEEDEQRFEISTASAHSYDTFWCNTYQTEPKPTYGAHSNEHNVAPPAAQDAEAELQKNKFERSMQLAANMIQAMHLQAVPRGKYFTPVSLCRATLWQDAERGSYFFQVFDLIVDDPELFLKLGSADWLSENPEPLLLVTHTLWDKTQNLKEATMIINQLKLRTCPSRSLS